MRRHAELLAQPRPPVRGPPLPGLCKATAGAGLALVGDGDSGRCVGGDGPVAVALSGGVDSLPMVNAIIAELAAGVGAEVLLPGNGADELLSTPRYAVVEVATVHGLRAARRYLADMSCRVDDGERSPGYREQYTRDV